MFLVHQQLSGNSAVFFFSEVLQLSGNYVCFCCFVKFFLFETFGLTKRPLFRIICFVFSRLGTVCR